MQKKVHLITAFTLFFSVFLPAARGGTTIQYEVELPPGVKSGTLLCGVMNKGLELGQRRMEVARLSNIGRFSGEIASELSEKGDQPNVYLTINRDDLGSYIPSVGDIYQIVPLKYDGTKWLVKAQGSDWKEKREAAPGSTLTVHYYRFDKTFENASLWTWDEHQNRAPKENEIYPVGRDDFGLIFQVDTALYGKPGDKIGLLPRRNADWQKKDGGDRYWSPSMGKTVFLVQGENELYTEVPDVSPKVRAVTLDADHHLTVRFSHRLLASDWTPDKFKVSTSTGEQLTVKAVHPFKHRGEHCAVYSIETLERFEYPGVAYALTVEGFDTYNVRVGFILTTGDRFYDPEAELGAVYTPEKTEFKVFAPGALIAKVLVADEVEGDKGVVEHEMVVNNHGVWSASVNGNLEGKYYAYKLGGIGFDPDVEITDIYAKCTQALHTRSLIVDLDKTDPPGFDDYVYNGPMTPADAVIYEMHIRDFTIAANSGVKSKGKYLGLTESGTTLEGNPAIKTGIDHLVELGVTHVQIMPFQDFDNGETNMDSYNWGYMPVHFNSPEGWYAGDPLGPGRIAEVKAAIKAFHDRGIGVIMDVVYNHTADRSSFNDLVPGYYYRLTPSGNFSNGSGCGNEFASEHPMARKFLLDSVKYWVQEYKVDGYRFDLMGLIDLETMKQIKKELAEIHPGILVYGEPWTGGATPLKPITDKDHTRATGIGAFNDGFRDAVKGGRDGGDPGFIQCGDRSGDVVKGLMGAIHDWAHDPVDAVSYFAAHDNLTAWDKLLQSEPDATDDERRQMMKLGMVTLFTAQGMSFIHGGQEFCRTKKGSHNSYNLPDEINNIDWSWKKTHHDVFEYTRGMIALRKAHPSFRLHMRRDVEERVSFHTPPDHRCIVYHIHGEGLPGETANRIIVLLNGAKEAKTFELPEGDWDIYVDATRAGTKKLGTAKGKVELPRNSGMVLMH